MPITAMVAASASLKDAQLVPERKRINARIRGDVFAWLDRNGYSYIPSQSNCFMLDTKRPGEDGDRRHGQAERVHRPHLAGVAHLRAHHDWNRGGDGAVPDGVAKGDDGRGDGERGSHAAARRIGRARRKLDGIVMG